jgi:hypothetical protein
MRTRTRVAIAGLVVLAGLGWLCWPGPGRHQGPGRIEGARLPEAVVADRAQRQAEAVFGPGATRPPERQILFGDFHVHTTFSTDAYLRSLPLMAGEGVHPPADACDFARFCADLDFWSLNDHSEALTPAHWAESVASIRECAAIGGDGPDPDLVPFLGWEWTQVGATPESHYGHKNVVLREIAEGQVPSRPISARASLTGRVFGRALNWRARVFVPLLDFRNRRRYYDFARFLDETRAVPDCPEGVDVRELPDDCAESADTPDVLFEKLRQWDFAAFVIPHGNTWGFYTPPGSSWDKQLAGRMHDPELQTLVEVYSGHGNSEEYRDWRAVAHDAEGHAGCPEPDAGYEPCCWRAGELIRARCEAPESPECAERVAAARQSYVDLGVAGHNAVPGATVEEWGGCGQCLDCFNPSFNYRPGGSTQYAMALSNFDDPAAPRRFRFGFLASSDNHSARPGTGYKELARRSMTEASGARDSGWRERFLGGVERSAEPFVSEGVIDLAELPENVSPLRLVEAERQASFFMTGGLVAVHAAGRDRQAIWQALERREVYGTSGERILLWFDLVNAPGGSLPMGSELELAWSPRFRVRAAGSFEQLPGCPEHARHGLTPERLERLCRGECYHPADRRRAITRIEVVRIRPQVRPEEPAAPLIEDPWRRFLCAREAAGCVVEFEDPDFVASGRPALYYVRAIQEPTPAVNAANLRCRFDETGRCVEVDPCYGDYRTPFDDDCLAPNEERAWSSPIFLTPATGETLGALAGG